MKAADTLTWALRSEVAAADPRVIVLGGGLMADGRLLPRLVGERWPAVRPRCARGGRPPGCGPPGAGLLGARIAS